MSIEHQNRHDVTGAILSRSKLQEHVHSWADATFGQCTPELAVHRLDLELAEFFEDPRKEACDVLILLLRYAAVAKFDLFDSALAKMEVNKTRTWVTAGNGIGQHTGSQAAMGLLEQRDAARQRISDLEDNAARLEGRMGTALNRIRELEDERNALSENCESAFSALATIYAVCGHTLDGEASQYDTSVFVNAAMQMQGELANVRRLYDRDNQTFGRMVWALGQERDALREGLEGSIKVMLLPYRTTAYYEALASAQALLGKGEAKP